MSLNSLPPLPEIEHVFFMTAAVLGAAGILAIAIGELIWSDLSSFG
jgi:hypothetical protein